MGDHYSNFRIPTTEVGLHTIARDSPRIICLYGFNLPVPRTPQRPPLYYKLEDPIRKAGRSCTAEKVSSVRKQNVFHFFDDGYRHLNPYFIGLYDEFIPGLKKQPLTLFGNVISVFVQLA